MKRKNGIKWAAIYVNLNDKSFVCSMGIPWFKIPLLGVNYGKMIFCLRSSTNTFLCDFFHSQSLYLLMILLTCFQRRHHLQLILFSPKITNIFEKNAAEKKKLNRISANFFSVQKKYMSNSSNSCTISHETDHIQSIVIEKKTDSENDENKMWCISRPQ